MGNTIFGTATLIFRLLGGKLCLFLEKQMKLFLVIPFISIVHCLQCNKLLPGQYICEEPVIDPETQAEKGCNPNKTLKIACHVARGIQCDGEIITGNETGFFREISCRYVTGKSFETALLLSIFLGVFGIDRFYLGYPAIGLFKFCTLGFFMIFHFIDIVLIATQVLKPADGSDYYMDYFGHRLIPIRYDNDTYWLPP